jgi:hypothetical protein
MRSRFYWRARTPLRPVPLLIVLLPQPTTLVSNKPCNNSSTVSRRDLPEPTDERNRFLGSFSSRSLKAAGPDFSDSDARSCQPLHSGLTLIDWMVGKLLASGDHHLLMAA